MAREKSQMSSSNKEEVDSFQSNIADDDNDGEDEGSVEGLSGEELRDLALEFHFGSDETEPDLQLAVKYYQMAADLGDLESCYNLALCYEKGEGVNQDIPKAVELYHKAADAGDAQATTNLAVRYENGEGVERDTKKAIKLYQKAVDANDARACFNLALCYEAGNGVDQDMSKAVELYTRGADADDPDSCANLGFCYQYGNGVEQDMTKAVELYKRAVESDVAEACFNLAFCYEHGNGVERDLTKAVELYQKAVDAGYMQACSNLGVCYENGKGVRKDLKAAVELYQKAADVGDTGALFNLGLCYENGGGVAKDMAMAAKFYQRASEQDDPESFYMLGLLYFYGRGVQQDFQKGLELVKKGSERGRFRHKAKGLLGAGYMSGHGNPKGPSTRVAEATLRESLRQADVRVDENKYLLANVLASSTLSDSLREAKNVAESITEDSEYYVRAQWLLPFIDDQIENQIHWAQWKVEPKPDFILDAEIQLIAKIGVGFFGTVYLGRYRQQEWVAVKYLNIELVKDDKELARNVMRERFTCRVISSNDAEGAIGYRGFVDDMGNAQRGLVFDIWADITDVESEAMRIVDLGFVAARDCDLATIDKEADWSGRVMSSLRQSVVFAPRRPALPQLLGILHDVAVALRALHMVGYIHRDVAARNVLCDKSLNVKLADFGLAKYVGSPSDDSSEIAEYHKYLTPDHQYAIAWWAPECIGDKDTKAVFSTNSDVYAFGVVMWQCFARADPFDSRVEKRQSIADPEEAVARIATRILAGDRPDLNALAKDTPADVKNLIIDCWDADPEKRPTLTRVIQRLDEIQQTPHKTKPVLGSGRQLKQKWHDVKKHYSALNSDKLRRLALTNKNPGSYLYQRLINMSRKISHEHAPCRRLNPTTSDRFRFAPKDVFLIHTGAQKEDFVKPMHDIFALSGLDCFLDQKMKNPDGAPTEQMMSALQTCRHAVVVLSKSFVTRKDPCAELCYAFDRMEWIRQHHAGWESLWIVLFDISVEEYKMARSIAPKELPNLGEGIVMMKWHEGKRGAGGGFATWPDLCEILKAQIVEHDRNDGAIDRWKQFLEHWDTFDDKSFPFARADMYRSNKRRRDSESE